MRWKDDIGYMLDDLLYLLNENSRISIPVRHFTDEWKAVFCNVINGLEKAGMMKTG